MTTKHFQDHIQFPVVENSNVFSYFPIYFEKWDCWLFNLQLKFTVCSAVSGIAKNLPSVNLDQTRNISLWIILAFVQLSGVFTSRSSFTNVWNDRFESLVKGVDLNLSVKKKKKVHSWCSHCALCLERGKGNVASSCSQDLCPQWQGPHHCSSIWPTIIGMLDTPIKLQQLWFLLASSNVCVKLF